MSTNATAEDLLHGQRKNRPLWEIIFEQLDDIEQSKKEGKKIRRNGKKLWCFSEHFF